MRMKVTMKNKDVVLVAIMALGLTQIGQAANLVWTPTTANWDLTSTNWKDTNTTAIVTFAQGDSVLFDDTGLGQPSVGLGTNLLSPSAILVDATGQYSFASTTGGKLTGGLSLVKRGSGALILDADNAISGPTSIEGGLLQLGNGSSRGSVGRGPITNLTGLIVNRTGTLNMTNNLTGAGGFTNRLNATINLYGTNTMSGPILIQVGMLSLLSPLAQGSSSEIILDSSPGGTANSRLGFTGGINLPASATLKLLGTSSTGPTRCTVQTVTAGDATTNSVNGPILIGSGSGLIQINGVSTGAGLLQINGNISNHPDNATPFAGTFYLRGAGNGTLSGTVNLPEASFVRTDAGTFTVASTGNHWGGTLVAVGRLRLGADDALPLAPFSIGQATGTNAILDLNGFNQQLPGFTSVHGANTNLPIIANSSTTSDSTLIISAPAGVYGGLIQDTIAGGTRRVGLRIVSGAQQLTGNCTYSGPTTILGGGLVLKDYGSISNTTSIEINGPSAVDVSLRTDGTLWLGTAQQLKGSGTFNITGNLTSKGTIELRADKSGGAVSHDTLAVSGQLTFGGKLKLALSGEALNSTDTLPIFTAGSYASAAVAAIEPASPGPGLMWDTSTLIWDGTLRIAGPITGTAILAPSGKDIIFSGNGGVANGGFSVVTSTNVSAPLASWTTAQTGSFDAGGNFSVALPITPGAPRQFFVLRVP